MPIFCVKSVKVYTGQKKFTRVYSWLSWQISGMLKSGIPEMCYHKLRIPEMCQLKLGNTFQEFLNWAGSFREFSTCGSSIQEFLNWAGPFREFLIWGGTFQEFLIWGWPFYENFLENCRFLACFRLQWISFWLLTLIYSDAKKLVKNAQSCVK